MDTRRISIAPDTDVVSGIYVMPDCIPAVMPTLAAVPQAASEVAQTKPRSDCSVNLLLPVDGSIEPLDNNTPDLLPAVISVRTAVAEVWMERFVLVPEACPVVSMTSTVARTFGPALSEEYSPVVLAGGGGAVAAAYPLVVVESDTARVSVLPMVESDTARVSGTDSAFSSGKAPGWWSARADACAGTVRAFGPSDYMDRWTFGGDASSGAVRAFCSRKVLAR